MKTIAIKPDTSMKRYLTAVSVLLLLFTVAIPPLGIAFAVSNVILLAIWQLLKRERPNRLFRKQMIWGTVLSNGLILLYFSLAKSGLSGEGALDYSRMLLCGEVAQDSMAVFLSGVYQSLQNQESSMLSALLLAPLLKLFGGSFTAYVLLVFNLVLVPFFIVLGLLIREINSKSVPLVFLFTPFLSPVLRGSLDGVCLLYIGLWMHIVYKQTFRKKATKKALVLGALSVLPVLAKWENIYFLLGIFGALFLSLAVRWLYDKTYRIKPFVRNFGLTGIVILCLSAIVLFPGFHQNGISLPTPDGKVYLTNIKGFLDYYGVLPLAFCLLGIHGLWRRHLRQFTLFLLFYLPLVFLLVAGDGVLSPGQHCLFAPALFLLAVVGVSSLRKMKKPALILLYAVFAVSFLYTYVPGTGDFLPVVFPAERFAPETVGPELLAAAKNTLFSFSPR